MRQILGTRLRQRRGRFELSLALGLALAALAALVSTPAHATFPGENGRIVFAQLRSATDYNRAALVTMNPNGTGIRDVIDPPRGVFLKWPDWSPNGRWIAYERSGSDHPSGIVRIRADGTDPKNLTRKACRRVARDCVGDVAPAWSPSGRRIAFGSGIPPFGIAVMRANGTDRRQVTRAPESAPFEDFHPAWSPDGKRLAFERYRESPINRAAIFTVHPDGTHMKRLTPWALDAGGYKLDWSPNGRWIIFPSNECCQGPNNVWVVHPNGTGLKRLTENPGREFVWGTSSFSPDGTMIATARFPGVGAFGAGDVFLMNAGGGGLFNLTQSARFEGNPDWGPG